MTKHRIDLTPKWENLTPMFLQWIKSGTQSQKILAEEEVTRLAVIVDTFMAHRKHGKITCECGETFTLS